MRIKQIMTTRLVEVQENDHLQLLSEHFTTHRIHHIPVVDEQHKLVGIVSDRDVRRALSPFIGTDKERPQDTECLSITAKEVMSPKPITVTADTRIDTASILLLEHNFSCLPILAEDGSLEGIVTWKDILNYYVYSTDSGS